MRDVARDRRLDDLDALVAERLRELGLRGSDFSRTSRRIAPCRSLFKRAPPGGSSSPWASSPVVMDSGGVSRSVRLTCGADE